MSARVTTAVEECGRVLACKRASDDDDRARLRHETTMLGHARHPGVVELVSCDEQDDVTTLYTLFVGTHTLETAPPRSIERAGAVVARAAATVADLHDLGIVHGRIDPSHVLLGARGRPVLCGFTGAGAPGAPASTASPPMVEYRDPAADDTLATTLDVFGLGTLLRALVVGDGAELEPIPDRRFVLRRPQPWSGYLRRSLLTLADQSTDPEPRRRPSARRLAADIHSLLPRTATVKRPDPAARVDAGDALAVSTDQFEALRASTDDDSARRGRSFLALAGCAGVALSLWACAGLRGERTANATATPASTTSSPDSPSAETRSAADAAASAAQRDPTTTTIAAVPNTVTIDGHRYEIGEPGDRVALGDWNCDGTPTIALARPRTGQVFVFDAWPSPDGELRASPLAGVTAAVDLRSDERDGCATLVVLHADGTETEAPS